MNQVQILIKKKEGLYFYIIFFLSLHSYYFENIKLAIFPPLAFLILLYKTQHVQKKYLFFLFSVLLLFSFSTLIGFFNNNYTMHLPTLLGCVMGPIFLISFLNVKNINEILFAIKKVLQVHLFFFFMQVVFYYLFEQKLDYLYSITGEHSRNEAFGVITGLFRPSGLFNEPATYSLYIFGFSAILFLNTKNFNLTVFLSFISLLITFSGSGIFFFLIFSFILIYELFSKKGVFIFISAIVLAFFTMSYSENIFIKYITSRFSNGIESDGSLAQRYTSAISTFKSSNFTQQFFGYGIGNTPENLDTAVGSGLTAQLLSFGYFFNFLLIFLFSYLLFINKSNNKIILIYLLLLFTTMTYNNWHYWLFLGLAIISPKYNSNKENYNSK